MEVAPPMGRSGGIDLECVFGDLDCNDNTPVLKPIMNSGDLSPSNPGSVTASPIRCPSRASIISDSNTTGTNMQPGLEYSPEDALNNDFFYDDEFAIQFDATLTDLPPEAQILRDSMDVPTLLSISHVCDDNERWRISPHMVISKSDSCLYQADLDLSSSDREMSQEFSTSEREYISSSDMSDLRSEPLFSPAPNSEDHYCALPNTSSREGELSGSFNNGERYSFDYTAHKNQYMLSFDRSPTKGSNEGSAHREVNGSLTSWAQQSEGSQYSWGSNSSRQGYQSANSGPNCFTTWRQIQLKDECVKGAGELTTWQQVQRTNPRSQSFPQLKKPQTKHLRKSRSHEPTLLNSSTSSSSSEDKRSSVSLFELFQRKHSQSDESMSPSEENEAMISPTSLQKLTGTWSMSPMSSIGVQSEEQDAIQSDEQDSSQALSPCATMGNGLISWNTLQNLNNMNSHSVCTGDSLYSSAVKSTNWVFSNGACKSSGSDCCSSGESRQMNVSAQAGSAILSASKLGKACQDCGVQFPPRRQDSGCQTSLEEVGCHAWTDTANKCLQTSLQSKRVLSKVDSATQAITDSRCGENVKLSSRAEKRLAKTSYLSHTTLPDLSFLNKRNMGKGMSASVNIEETPLCHVMHNKVNNDKINVVPSDKKHKKDVKQTVPKSLEKPKIAPKPQFSLPGHLNNIRNNNKSRNFKRTCPSPCRDSLSLHRNGVVRLRNDSTCTNSVCSTSSSGIDPGSYDSVNHKAYQGFGDHSNLRSGVTSDLGSDSGSDTSHRKDLKYFKPGVKIITADMAQFPIVEHPQRRKFRDREQGKFYKTTCTSCNASTIHECEKHMISSHPTFAHSSSLAQELKNVEYLQVSPVHKTFKSRAQSRIKSTTNLRSVSVSPDRCDCRNQQYRYQHARSQSEPTEKHKDHVVLRRQPLKSCLIKRQRDRRAAVALKHRSWSDPYDATIMKYSQDGETRYQLITNIDGSMFQEIPLEVMTVEDHKNIQMMSMQPDMLQMETYSQKPCPSQKIIVQKSSNVQCSSCNATACSVTHGTSEVMDTESHTTSPDQIPIPAGTPRNILQSSDSDSAESAGDLYRSKKSVSFSEEVSYHSPYSSPHQSPRKVFDLSMTPDALENSITRHQGKQDKSSPSRAKPESASCEVHIAARRVPLIEPLLLDLDSSGEGPPNDFLVSPTRSKTPSLPPAQDMSGSAKKELVLDVINASEAVITHFNLTDHTEKMKLASTASNPEIGYLILKMLCPALYALLLDGLKPYIRSLFGRVKNTVWKVIEDSAEPGPCTRIICDLVHDLKALTFLNTTWLKFNAFIFGLLNHKALDFWLSYLHGHDGLLRRHYTTTSFLQMSVTSGTKTLYLDMITALQPLGQISFRLEYDLEWRTLQERHQQKMANYMLDRHTARATEAHLEGQQVIQQQIQNQKMEESRELATTSSSPDLGRQTRELLQNAGKQLWSKLHQSKSADSVTRAAVSLSPPQSTASLILRRSESAGNNKEMQNETGRQWLDKFYSQRALISQVSLDSLGSLTSWGQSDKSQSTIAPEPGLHPLHVASVDSQTTEMSDEAPSVFHVCNESISSRDVSIEERRNVNSFSQDTKPMMEHHTPTNRAVPVIRNNTILNSELEESDNEQSDQGFLSHLSKQIRDITASPTPDVYMKGVTEYEFEPQKAPCERPTLDGIPAQSSGSNSPALPRSQTSPSLATQTPPVVVRQRSAGYVDASKRLSDNVSSSAVGKGRKSSLLRKSFSSFGPSLINLFDKLLLDSTDSSSCGTSPLTSPLNSPVMSTTDSVSHRQTQPTTSSTSGSLNTAGRRRELQNTRSTSLPVRQTGDVLTADNQPRVTRQVRALCHYIASQEDQLSFDKLNILDVLEESSDASDWLLCRHESQQGFVHKGCVQSLTESPPTSPEH